MPVLDNNRDEDDSASRDNPVVDVLGGAVWPGRGVWALHSKVVKIRSLELNDFQAHRKTVLEFSPTITTIIGPTDAGKSATLRALRWVCLNDIAGEEFIKEGAKRTTVTMVVQDKDTQNTITRVRSHGAGINTYELDGQEYKAFSTAVPADIATLLKLNEINFQGQHDSPFWFNETAGEVSRRLNAVVDLTVIDTALTNVAQEVRRAQERKALCAERLVEVKEDLDLLLPEEPRIEQFRLLKAQHDKVTETQEACDTLASRIEKIRDLRTAARESEEKSLAGADVLSAAAAALGLEERYQSLGDLLERSAKLKKVQAPPDFGPVEEAFDRVEEAREAADALARLVDKASRMAEGVDTRAEALKAAEKRFHEQTNGKECPLCGTLIQ